MSNIVKFHDNFSVWAMNKKIGEIWSEGNHDWRNSIMPDTSFKTCNDATLALLLKSPNVRLIKTIKNDEAGEQPTQ